MNIYILDFKYKLSLYVVFTREVLMEAYTVKLVLLFDIRGTDFFVDIS